MDRDEVLNEVAILATLEHFFIVECLSVECALGHDLEAGEGGPTDPRGRESIGVVMGYAQFTLMAASATSTRLSCRLIHRATRSSSARWQSRAPRTPRSRWSR